MYLHTCSFVGGLVCKHFDVPPRKHGAHACAHESMKTHCLSEADAARLRCRSFKTLVSDEGEDDNSTPLLQCRATNLLPRIVSCRREFPKYSAVFYAVTFYRRGTWALTFEH